ncbi:TlpA disulfide reductase family protein [Sphingomonas naphthae]|uniref:TlpA disulfide reductase family protein n=1 Tax=Sphingomonas naphthae TaxID=1813468 RepID=A0ABY7TJJ6_9SPHN|nr:TlpA disulfide reductase family protein [Sphingomonas naphthae]WCT73396.1 TlpA disulfide reductase family protein [Sphingomonas naphthae]
MLKRLAVIALALMAAACNRTPDLAPGQYRAVLKLPLGELPVGLEVAAGGKVTFVNGANKVAAEQATIDGDTLNLAFPSYDSTISATQQDDGTLSGVATLRRRTGPVQVPFVATPNTAWRFWKAPAPATGKLAGTWLVTPADPKDERGLLILTDAGNGVLTGSVQWPSGDERWLTGQVNGAEFALSTFDGNQGGVWRGRLRADGSIAGESFGATSTTPSRFTARRQGAAPEDQVVAIGEEKPPVDRIAFTFPDMTGKPVSLADERFKGKVVVVSIGGTWCPNCHDESAFLSPYVKKRRAEGLEAIALQFEYTDDPARSAAQAKKFAARYAIDYPMLIAGKATPEDSARALPDIGGVKIYPTTLFIDRKGKLRAIHTGYAGPATGELNRKAVAEFDALVSKLLAEPA